MTSFAAFGMAPAAAVGGIIEFPVAGALIGWFLVAALLGSLLGVLSRMGGTPRPATGMHAGGMVPADDAAAERFHAAADRFHKEAA